MKKPGQRSPFFIRLLNWEYWPFTLVYIPVFVYWFLLGIRARAPLFFTAANPAIPTGGLAGESKSAIMQGLPAEWKPQERFLVAGADAATASRIMDEAGLEFPVVLKPDVGERGMLVAVMADAKAMQAYRSRYPIDFLVQTFVDYPLEVSILHSRMPDAKKGEITSVTIKRYLQIEGDGQSTVAALVAAYPRARLQQDTLAISHADRWNDVLPAGEVLQFHTIGNHNKGCQFLNGNDRISPALVAQFDRIADHLPGIFYARYDIKYRDWNSLLQGEAFCILEINGVKSEPTHIYDPGYSVARYYRDVLAHWNIIYRISQANRRRGIPVMSVREGWGRLVRLRRYHQQIATHSS